MKWIAGVVICLFFVSCSDKKAIPGDIIPVKPMQKIVWDMLQADELAFNRKIADSTINLKAVSFQLYDTVFAIHKITRESFYKSYEYYQRHPALYKTLMTGVRTIGDSARRAQRPSS